MGKRYIRISTNSNLPSPHQVSKKEIKGLLTFMSWIRPMNRMWFWASDAHAATQLQRSHSPHGPGFSHGHIQTSPCGMHVQKTSWEILVLPKNAPKQNFELSTQAFFRNTWSFSGPISPHHPYSFFRTGSKSSLERFCFNTYFLSNLTLNAGQEKIAG